MLAAAGGAILLTFGWAYWPTLVKLVSAWNREPDYSHGFLVLPAAILFLWIRSDRFPGWPGKLAWSALILIAASIVVRMLGARYYVDALDGWSLIIWLAGVVWFFGGGRVLRWSLPSIAFLWFMVPLPFGLEHYLKWPLQRISTEISAWCLQFLGQPAFATGNVIDLDGQPLLVAEACSGLRIFMGIAAVAFACLILFQRSWWEKLLIVLAILPISLVANSTRVVITGLLYQLVSSDAGQAFSHNVAGYVMILYALALFLLVLWYLGKLFQEVEEVDVGEILRQRRI
jgi:exosortase